MRPAAPGQQTGYTDRQLTHNRWRVTFTGNSVTPRETVENDLLLRAAEVTLAAGYSHFLFDTRNTEAQTTLSTRSLSARDPCLAAAGAVASAAVSAIRPAGVMARLGRMWIS